MGKTYDALKKAEQEKMGLLAGTNGHGNGHGNGNGNGHGNGNGKRQTATEYLVDSTLPAPIGYQKVRVWLNNYPTANGQRLKTVMVVATRSGTGNTTTAALLASTLAEGGKSRVLIVDGNFRTPSLNMVFEVKNDGGFTEVVTDDGPLETHIQPTNRKNLFVLTSGKISNVPVEVFEGESIDRILAHLREQFDFVVFDAAPALEFPDAFALAPRVDVVILVVESEKTPIDEAQRAKRELERAGARILGVVLNRYKNYTPKLLKGLLGAGRD
jgi:protein-tyrosine kinase